VTVGPLDPGLRAELLALEVEDLRVRAELAADGSLFEGYHQGMEAVHRANAARLREVLDETGWPGERRVGPDGAAAAWRIAQHAIAEPDFQRRCLALLDAAAADGDVPAWQPAFLEDRIRVFEGRPQRYATQLDTDAAGRLVPYPVEDPDRVEARREAVGLEPLAAQLAQAQAGPAPDPATHARRQAEWLAWLQRVGWRSG
jgi:hypothetical protein